MAYGVELRFDDHLADRVRDLRRALAGVGAAGFGPGGEPVPHISLAVYDDEAVVDASAVGERLDRLARRWSPLPVTFAGLGVFPTEERVLYLAPVVTPALLEIHDRWHAMAPELEAACRAYYLRGRWMPHCTLSMLGPLDALLGGLGRIAAEWTTLAGSLQSIALIRVPPVETLAERPLSRSPHAA